MKITSTTLDGRQGWQLDSGMISLFLMKGGGHIADLRLKGLEKINPLWKPPWKSIEPWKYRKSDARKYGGKLLSCIYGHNLCLGAFGDPSPEEMKCGLGCHYEAPVGRWSVIRKKTSKRGLCFEYGCDLPVAQMRVERRIVMKAGSGAVNIRETVENLARRDVPFTTCQHVTFGPPFLERNVTAFDMPATLGQTFPEKFSDAQRLKRDAKYTWPAGPGQKGKIDLRFMGKGSYGDFHANLIDPKREHAWFSAVNPQLGLMVAYVWQRKNYPWVGVWEESFARQESPWSGRTLTRGMEFANTPFPMGLRKAVDLGAFQGQRAYAWLPARGKLVYEYALLALQAPESCWGVADISPAERGFELELLSGSGKKITVKV